MIGPGWCCKSRLAPTIDHPPDVCNSTLFGARVIFVGHPVGILQCTPWVNPCYMVDIKSPTGGSLDFDAYFSMRADKDEFLMPLLGCHLVCSCSLPGLNCHARYLQSMCVKMIERHGYMNDHIEDDDHPHNRAWDHDEYDDSHDEVDHADRITALDETLIGVQTPNHVAWPDSWHLLVESLRMLPNKAFWELFSGSARATIGFQEAGWSCGQPVDVANDETFNLLDPCFLALVIALIWEGLVALLWLGPPCSSFSMAVNRFWKHATRSMLYPQGFPWLTGNMKSKVMVGNALAVIACRLFNIAVAAGSV
jgi:hypothetical protein